MNYLQESYDDALKENEMLKAKLEQTENTLKEIVNLSVAGDCFKIRKLAKEAIKSIEGEG